MGSISRLTTKKTYDDEIERVLKDAVQSVLKVVSDNNDKEPTGPMIPLLVYMSVFQMYAQHNRGKTYATDEDFDNACAFVYEIVMDKFPLLGE